MEATDRPRIFLVPLSVISINLSFAFLVVTALKDLLFAIGIEIKTLSSNAPSTAVSSSIPSTSATCPLFFGQ